MKDTYVYPALFDYADDGISIRFPDLAGCLPCAQTTDEAVRNAKEALGLHLWGMERDGDEIPNPTNLLGLKTEPNQAVCLIDIFMPPVRERLNNRFVKKTLSIPAWLNYEAENKGVNFSQTLQKALRDELQLS